MLRAAVLAFFIASGLQAWAQVPLIAEDVFVADPAEASASSFGIVGMPGRSVAGLAALGEGPDGKPQVQLLGCRFDIELQRTNKTLSSIEPIFSKKLTSSPNADPPSAGYGVLRNPKPVGIVDPVTSIACTEEFHYVVFLFRQGTSSRTPAIEALVFEFNLGEETALEAEQFYSGSEKPSVQARNAVRATRGFYRVVFRSAEDLDLADREQQQLNQLMAIGFKLWVSGGIPFP